MRWQVSLHHENWVTVTVPLLTMGLVVNLNSSVTEKARPIALCEGFFLGALSSHYGRRKVVMAVGITALVAFALIVIAFQIKWDLTMMGGILFVLVIVLVCFGLLYIVIPGRVLNLVYASLGALIFSAYLVFDTQLMLEGKHKYVLSREQYIFAAVNLLLDIVNIFLFILSIIVSSEDKQDIQCNLL